ncbi:MAG: IreB family regulatory phosphoprotein [Clostridia bacterium]|nr:IreB family regulatory phosphoprotein [Clostridia bacterium]
MNIGDTQEFDRANKKQTAHEVLMTVYSSLREKGYDPLNQLVGYLISGDPTYVTSYNNARYLIRTLERDELLEEIVRAYIEQYGGDEL